MIKNAVISESIIINEIHIFTEHSRFDSTTMITFLAGFVSSFLGSLPVGAISLMVVRFAKERTAKEAIAFAAISAAIEFIHIYPAIVFVDCISAHEYFKTYFEYLSILFFGILGIKMLVGSKNIAVSNKILSWRTGIIINVLNPSSIPFWMFLSGWLVDGKYIDADYDKFIFSFAACVGTFCALAVYCMVGSKFFSSKSNLGLNFDKMIGMVFVLMALYKIILLAIS